MLAIQKARVDTSRLHCMFVVSQPLFHIRLPTYPLGNKLPDGNEKGLGYSSFARHYSQNRCLLSLPRGTKMFQFTRLPLSSPIYSGRCR